MIKKNDILEILDNNRNEIRQFGVKRIGVFGSFARNTPTRVSDVDILVEFHPREKTFDHYMDLKIFLEKKLRRKVDLVMRETLKSRIKPGILKDVHYAGL